MTRNARSRNAVDHGVHWRIHREVFRVILVGIGKDTAEGKESFCDELSEKYHIPRSLVKKIVDQCPIVIKKNIPLDKAESLAKILRSCGARVALEVKTDIPEIFLEFQGVPPHRLALEFCSFTRSRGGMWIVTGRARNISSDSLNDIWALVQLFGSPDDLLTFEEVPLALNPIPVGEAAPFKALFEGNLSIQRILIAFKIASGTPLAALDKRSKPEWTKVDSDDGDEAVMSITLTQHSRPHSHEPSEGEGEGKAFGSLTEDARPHEIGILAQTDPVPELVPGPIEERFEGSLFEGTPPAGDELRIETGEGQEYRFELHGDDVARAGEEVKTDRTEEPQTLELPPKTPSGPLIPEERSEAGDREREEERGSELQGDARDRVGVREVFSLDASAFEEASRLLQEISERDERKGIESVSFPWVEEFRKAIQVYFEERPDVLSAWVRGRYETGGFKDNFHCLLTLLVHARFDQTEDSLKALENTQRVVDLMARRDIPLDTIPELEGTDFCSGEQWRDLFYRAMPKLQQVCKGILERGQWKALEVQKLVQVIPYMSEKSSRKAVRWISNLMGSVVDIDLSHLPVSIDSNLYRVACRLGIVDPLFDAYQGRNSMGDVRIQAFAMNAFPKDPSGIEEPMVWVGRAGNGGHCFPAEPQCRGCLFESFCQRLCFHFDPSEKGMSHL